MLTRFVRIQLIVFATVSVIGLTTMIFGYLGGNTWLGVGHINVTVELPGTGGLYRFANVTYRGVQIGKVSNVEPTATGATAKLSLDSSPKVPANVEANVRSMSAVGEQYVDLVPRGGGPPYLVEGSVIARDDTTIPQKVGPVLDQLSAFVGSVPKQKLSDLLDETFLGFNGAGDDFGSLLDSGARIAAESKATAEHTRTLIDDTAPLLDSQAQSFGALRIWPQNFNRVTQQLVDDDAELRTVLRSAPGAADEASQLLTQLKPTLPVLLANMTTVGEIGVTYNASLRQLLVLLPPFVGGFGALSGMNNPTGYSLGSFSLMSGDPPACTVGFLPPSQWRSPNDLTDVDTPDDLYCKLPQDSPIAVRGIRNNPCMGKPGKRAPTVEICDSDKPFEPLAMKQHLFGPYPFDPNLVAQGVPPDSRATRSDNLYGPLDGTPLPPPEGAPAPAPDGAPPSPQQGNPPPDGAPPSENPAPPSENPSPVPMPPPSDDVPAAVPNAFSGNANSGRPAVAVANYDPRTGRYVGSDGLVYRQTDLATQPSTSWKDMLPR
jgi:phospholipid/cholesterol/gamma-HCH transport system substrate-binding protein